MRTDQPAKPDPQPGVDYYVENGCYVFTAVFLARRGWCCGNGCRHCPYVGDARRDRPLDAPRPA